MLDFENELKRYKPSLEIGDVEDEIKRENVKDFKALIEEILEKQKEG